ncbi:MAG: hypothetical protein EZS28_012622 [Streblomastix strix]|uniref:Uncharacterized protein n=1 Tax=Streblomastix strix TaxID=222440 RepID=A0A5J4WAD3_9EUKA|nr:MAG: hypothetical protein EZS28_012622 [Streblomastix strix]
MLKAFGPSRLIRMEDSIVCHVVIFSALPHYRLLFAGSYRSPYAQLLFVHPLNTHRLQGSLEAALASSKDSYRDYIQSDKAAGTLCPIISSIPKGYSGLLQQYYIITEPGA